MSCRHTRFESANKFGDDAWHYVSPPALGRCQACDIERDASILRDLAVSDPIDDHGNCTLCGAYVGGMPDENEPTRHNDPCPWKRARAR